LRYLIHCSNDNSQTILFIFSRFILIAVVLLIWFKRNRNQFNYEILKGYNWMFCSSAIIIISFLQITKNIPVSSFEDYYHLLAECISVGLLEELLFRYIVFYYFLNSTQNIKQSTILTAILFALFHISSLFFGSSIYSTINQIELAFIFGLIFQLIFIKTNNLLIISAIHATINFVGSHSTLSKNNMTTYFSLDDFIFNQLCILIVYLLIVPLCLWRLKDYEKRIRN
jgi:membrane protease YdiL (CAAX protease family)